MAKTSWGLIALAVMTGTAVAQPGATTPADPAQGAPAPPPAPPAEAPPADAAPDSMLDQLIAKAESEAPSIETVARGAFRRARRKISVGPTVGLWSAAILDPGDIDAALTFGIGIETFKVPVIPDMATLKALVMERVKAQAKDRIKAAFVGKPVEPLALEQMVKEVYEEVRKEILGLEDIRGKTMERPQYTVGFEANRLFGAERWLARTRVGIGVWKATLGISAAFGRVCRSATCDDGLKLFSGPEITVHFLTSKKPRASVVDVFMRFDLQATGRGAETYDQLVLGTRFLLDII